MSLVLILILGTAALAALSLVHALRHAESGYEDDRGYHATTPRPAPVPHSDVDGVLTRV